VRLNSSQVNLGVRLIDKTRLHSLFRCAIHEKMGSENGMGTEFLAGEAFFEDPGVEVAKGVGSV